MTLGEHEARELEFWRREAAGQTPLGELRTLASKLGEAGWLLARLERYGPLFAGADTILELGAGEGWGAAMVKRVFPQAEVIASDLSAEAVERASAWEPVVGAVADRTLACPSYDIPLEDGSVALTFAFQAAHHFRRHERTLAELHRVLRPGGTALYLHEPSCPQRLHRAAKARVNRKRPDVPEDVLVHSRLLELGRAAGFEASVSFDADPSHRGPTETLYYTVLARAPFLRPLLPCTADYRFVKPAT